MTANEKILLIKRMITSFYEGCPDGESSYSAILGAICDVVEFGGEVKAVREE